MRPRAKPHWQVDNFMKSSSRAEIISRFHSYLYPRPVTRSTRLLTWGGGGGGGNWWNAQSRRSCGFPCHIMSLVIGSSPYDRRSTEESAFFALSAIRNWSLETPL